MTIEDRLVLAPEDIQGIRIECGSCGAALLIRPEKWGRVPSQCPHCNSTWHLGDASVDLSNLNSFAHGLRALRATSSTAAFRLRLEIDRPKP